MQEKKEITTNVFFNKNPEQKSELLHQNKQENSVKESDLLEIEKFKHEEILKNIQSKIEERYGITLVHFFQK